MKKLLCATALTISSLTLHSQTQPLEGREITSPADPPAVQTPAPAPDLHTLRTMEHVTIRHPEFGMARAP